MSQSIPVNETDLPLEEPQRRRLSLGTMVLIAGILAVAAVFGIALTRQNAGQPMSGPAPDFSFTTFDGQSMKLSDLRGKIVVINFWASWCIPCREEAPELQSTWEAYKDSGDVVLLGIAYADNGPRSLAFMEEFGITYLNAPDLGTRISDTYNIQGVPETFVIAPDGTVSEFIYAGVTQEQLSAAIERARTKGSAS